MAQYGHTVSVCHVCKCLLAGIDTTLTLLTLLNGESSIDDVCLSILNIVGKEGAHIKILLPLNDEEIAALRNSSSILKYLIKGLNI